MVEPGNAFFTSWSRRKLAGEYLSDRAAAPRPVDDESIGTPTVERGVVGRDCHRFLECERAQPQHAARTGEHRERLRGCALEEQRALLRNQPADDSRLTLGAARWQQQLEHLELVSA